MNPTPFLPVSGIVVFLLHLQPMLKQKENVFCMYSGGYMKQHTDVYIRKNAFFKSKYTILDNKRDINMHSKCVMLQGFVSSLLSK